MPEKLAYSIEEAAEAIGISRSLIYHEMDAGRLAYIKVGRRRLITGQQLADYLTALESAA